MTQRKLNEIHVVCCKLLLSRHFSFFHLILPRNTTIEEQQQKTFSHPADNKKTERE
jgi:hypothetical protein